MDKEVLWTKINHRKFEQLPQHQKILSLIKSNLGRVEFVKDHICLRDVFFISEDDVESFSSCFLAVDVQCDKLASYKYNLQCFLEKETCDVDTVISRLEKFFSETKRTLFVGIGFRECQVDSFDEVFITHDLQEGVYDTIEEGLKEHRRFPNWYKKHAAYPDEITFISANEDRALEQLKQIEMSLLLLSIESALREEHDGAKTTYYLLADQYKLLSNIRYF